VGLRLVSIVLCGLCEGLTIAVSEYVDRGTSLLLEELHFFVDVCARTAPTACSYRLLLLPLLTACIWNVGQATRYSFEPEKQAARRTEVMKPNLYLSGQRNQRVHICFGCNDSNAIPLPRRVAKRKACSLSVLARGGEIG